MSSEIKINDKVWSCNHKSALASASSLPLMADLPTAVAEEPIGLGEFFLFLELLFWPNFGVLSLLSLLYFVQFGCVVMRL
jgi:hypothetical protein